VVHNSSSSLHIQHPDPEKENSEYPLVLQALLQELLNLIQVFSLLFYPYVLCT